MWVPVQGDHQTLGFHLILLWGKCATARSSGRWVANSLKALTVLCRRGGPFCLP